MFRFYVEKEQIKEPYITIKGTDVNHIKQVLRMKEGEKVVICDGQGKDFYCIITKIEQKEIIATIQSQKETSNELKTKLYLFQGLPKKDKMEFIIQKAVELGVYEIIPVITKRTIVKLEEKAREEKKLERWRSIAMSAAKQSNRGIIPNIRGVINLKEAFQMASALEYNVIPYEHAIGIEETRKVVSASKKKQSIGIFIGPEGGFEESEVKQAIEEHIIPITLGKRILRTETAGFVVLSIFMFELEREMS